MAINDVSLTAGMRTNLTSLQQTATLLDRTQYRLSTGKKVNSAIDNPTAFFAAQSLNSRASVIDGLKDAMGQAIQTVTAADKGITAITALIEQAKGIAQAAAAAPADSGKDTGTITLNGIDAGDSFSIGGLVDGITFSATSAAVPGTNEFLASGDNDIDKLSLANAINNANWAGALGNYSFTATVTDGVLSIAKTNKTTLEVADVVAGDFGVLTAAPTEASMAVTESTSGELASLQSQYNSVLDQINALASDSGYKGKNLLSGNTGQGLLSVKFEGTHKLDVTGFSAAYADLGLGQATWTTTPANIETDTVALDGALSTLRQNASSFSANLSIITTRQEFSTNMVNTLTEGANKLTLADTNEEGANMLMLQTRQSLGTTALSLSAQAAQSVLRLFG